MSAGMKGPSNGSTPCSEDGEKGLLCSLLLAPRVVWNLCSAMRDKNFFFPAHQIIFDTLECCPDPDKKVDFVWLGEALKSRDLLEEVGGKEYISDLYDFVPVPDNARYYRDRVLKACKRRLLKQLGDAEEPDNSPVWSELKRIDAIVSEDGSDAWLKPKLISELTTAQPPQILRGMLYQACKLVVMGGSKSFKTWTLMDIAYCVANGLLWWGVHTTKVPVLYLDFEFLDYDFRWRMEQIAAAHRAEGRQGNIDAVKRIGLKGKTLKDSHWPVIHEHIKTGQTGLVVCDPTYKLLGDRDENLSRDVAALLSIFDRITEQTLAAVIYAQHFSKGNQAGKESIDRGAGSGVWARDADAIIAMTKHKEEECLTIEPTLRSFSRIDPFVVRWTLPLFVRDAKLDPSDLKQPPKGGRESKYSVQDLINCLNGDDLSTEEFEKRFVAETGGSPSTFHRLRIKAEEAGVIHRSGIDQKWEKVKKS
jgi:hypothetical protein